MVRDLGDALDHAHAQGVVHRDVKPGNVLIRQDGVTKLADLGIATASDGTRITRSGTVLGTAAYMAPEQLDGREAGPPADIYALAAIAFEALSGRKPREGRTPMEIAHKIATEGAPDLRDAWPKAPKEAAAGAPARDGEGPGRPPRLRRRVRPRAGRRARGAPARDDRENPPAWPPPLEGARPPRRPPRAAPRRRGAAARSRWAAASRRGRQPQPAGVPRAPLPDGSARRAGARMDRRPPPRRRRGAADPRTLAHAARRATGAAPLPRGRAVRGRPRSAPSAASSSRSPSPRSRARCSRAATTRARRHSSADRTPAEPAKPKKQEQQEQPKAKKEPQGGARAGGARPGRGAPAPAGGADSGSYDPARGAALNDEGFTLMNAGNYDGAIPMLQQAVDSFPPGTDDINYAYALFNLGKSLRLAGRPDEAIPILEQRLEITRPAGATVQRELDLARQRAQRG